jgi:hypothetical protein
VIVGIDGAGRSVAVDLSIPAIQEWVERTTLRRREDIALGMDGGPPGAAVTPAGAIVLFWIGIDGALHSRVLNEGKTEQDLGAPEQERLVREAPVAVFLAGGDLRVLARTEDGDVYEARWQGGESPVAWTDIYAEGRIATPLALASWDDGRIDAFAISRSRELLHTLYALDEWWGWETLGGNFDPGVGAVSWAQGRIDILTAVEGHAWHKFTNGDGWWPDANGDFIDMGGPIGGMSVALSRGVNTLDLFGQDGTKHLRHRWHATVWGGSWIDTGLIPESSVSGVVASGAVHLFARNSNGTVWHVTDE